MHRIENYSDNMFTITQCKWVTKVSSQIPDNETVVVIRQLCKYIKKNTYQILISWYYYKLIQS